MEYRKRRKDGTLSQERTAELIKQLDLEFAVSMKKIEKEERKSRERAGRRIV